MGLIGRGKATRLCSLSTPFRADGWAETHPRPQLRRDSWLSLCGEWSLAVKSGGGIQPLGSITVPYPPESQLSGVSRPLGKSEQWLYTREFTLPKGFGERMLLHFGAVDQCARVEINGRTAGEHIGGYLPFELDVTDLLHGGANTVAVEVTDTLDPDLPYGKQRYKRGGMWYTPISGIWQPVWLEGVPEQRVRSLRITPTLDSVTIETVGGGDEKLLAIDTPDGPLAVSYRGNSVTVAIDRPRLWSPEDPHLYEFTLTAGADVIHSYFALRTVDIRTVGGQAYICLNGKPRFFHGLLDQGYFSDGIYIPASPEGYEFDVLAMKKLGFNTLRKHIKLEPEAFYHYCDRHGMIVFQDMVNSGRYSFLLDTALPTAGLRRGVTHRASRRRREQFERDAADTISLLYNHPCVCCYTIFNEGWGQYSADSVYRKLKALDRTRVFDATSGWFRGRESDLSSEHIYFKRVSMRPCRERPVVLSEFGGYSMKIPDHSFNLDNTYGYKLFDDLGKFNEALMVLYLDEIVPAIGGGLNAAILTQVSDVEDETNGLVTYDRQVEKCDEATMREVARRLDDAFAQKANG